MLGGVILAVLMAGCSRVQHGYEIYQALQSVQQPGHVYATFYQRSNSMAPTLRAEQDTAIVDKSAYGSALPHRGDIIAFMPPLHAAAPFLKRILAVPGDAVAIVDGRIAVNGKPLPAPFPPLRPDYSLSLASYRILVDGRALDPGLADVPPRSRWTRADRLPKGCYFVIGDNVNLSEDSHVFGCAELGGNFSTGIMRGRPTMLVGRVVKIVRGVRP